MAARIREGVQLAFGGVLHPRRWPPTRLSRCSAVQSLATWSMWRRCLSGTRSSRCASWPARRTQVSDCRVLADALAATAAHSEAAFAEPGLEPKTVAALRAGAARWRAQLVPNLRPRSRPLHAQARAATSAAAGFSKKGYDQPLAARHRCIPILSQARAPRMGQVSKVAHHHDRPIYLPTRCCRLGDCRWRRLVSL